MCCGPAVTSIDRVFIAAQTDDSYVYHAHLEIFSRILYHSSFLVANSDVMILWGCDSKKVFSSIQSISLSYIYLSPYLSIYILYAAKPLIFPAF